MISRLMKVVIQNHTFFDFKKSVLSAVRLCIPSHLWALGKIRSGLDLIGSYPFGLLARRIFVQLRAF